MPRKGEGRMIGHPVTNAIPNPAGGVKLETFIPWTLVKRGVKQQVITPIDAPEAFRVEAVRERRESKAAQDPPAVRALGFAHYWQHLLDTGRFESLTEIAAAEGMDLAQVSRIARLAWVREGVVEAVLGSEHAFAGFQACTDRNRRLAPTIHLGRSNTSNAIPTGEMVGWRGVHAPLGR